MKVLACHRIHEDGLALFRDERREVAFSARGIAVMNTPVSNTLAAVALDVTNEPSVLSLEKS